MTEAPEPFCDVAHLGHVELLTPRPAESLAFFTHVFGPHITDQIGQSVHLRAANILTEHDFFIEAGSARHNISQAMYLFLYEPGGNRVEIYSGGYLVFAPDWRPIIWRKAQRGRGVYRGAPLPESFKTCGTPFVEPALVTPQEPLIVFDPQ